MLGRIIIEDVRPRTPTGRYPAKASLGEQLPLSATIFRDGHDLLAAQVTLEAADGGGRQTVPLALVNPGLDQWQAVITPSALGHHRFVVEAWTDRQATWAKKTKAKLAAGQEIDVEIDEGIALFSSRAAGDPAAQAALAGLREGVVALALATPLPGPDGAPDVTASEPYLLWVDRERALVGAWYELFPRSYGGFKGAEERIPAVAGMGFDVLYLPPIHPIGTTERKGRDNTLGALGDDPGSPWAIGSADGGHTAIDPSLGTFEDFSHFLDTAREFGMEVALDYALQCSPDHPWVKDHPEWFHHRPDGSIAYAENPPKKYQDIFPINFWPDRDSDRRGLWEACRSILEFWWEKGVHIFRVDNPHTKPIAFWEWLISTFRTDHPGVIFLAEAFTRPPIMSKLGEVGFTQSYTYFTWRTERFGPDGIEAYIEALAGDKADYMRPNFWPNTPDILSGPLRGGPPAAFAIRMVLAATLVPSWGMYSGYELYENEPASPANEEYLHSEKYEIRHRDFDRRPTLAPFIATVNAIRRRHPALQRLRTTTFHGGPNPSIVAYSKVSDDGRDVVLVVVNLDPYQRQSSVLDLDLAALGVAADEPFTVVDQISGETWVWSGSHPYVMLEPWARVAHVFYLPDACPAVPGRRIPSEGRR